MRHATLLAAAILLSATLPAAAANAAPADPVEETMRLIQTSRDPEIVKLRRAIADGPRRLAAEKAAAKREGIPLTLPPMPPADQNAAPLYEKWINLNATIANSPPLYGDPLSARYIYTPAQIRRVRKAMVGNVPSFEELQSAAARRTCQGPNPESLGFGRYNEFARRIRTRAYLLTSDNRLIEAIATQKLGLKLARQIEATAVLPYLMSASIESVSLVGMRDILSRAGHREGVGAEVGIAVRDVNVMPRPRGAISGDLAYCLAEFEVNRPGAGRSDFARFYGERIYKSNLEWYAKLTNQQKSFEDHIISAEQAQAINDTRSLIAFDKRLLAPSRPQLKLPASEPLPGSVSANQELALMWEATHGRVELGNGLYRWYRNVRASEQITLAAAYALDVKSRTGAFPAALPASYTDPWSGKGLGYRVEPQGFVVYSVGEDGKFDGGKPGSQPHGKETGYRYPVVPVPRPGGYD